MTHFHILLLLTAWVPQTHFFPSGLAMKVLQTFPYGITSMIQSGYGPTRFNTLRTGDADLRFYITTVQDG